MVHPSPRLDAAAVKVLAHPLRSRLLSALRRGGPSTATALAHELETNTGATSYHLRKLESVGLVVDTGEGAGKRRLWDAASASHSWDASDFTGDEDATTALNWLMRDYLSQLVIRYQQWLDVEDTWTADWRDATSLDDDLLHLTAGQLQTLRSDLQAVIERYRDAGAGDPTARPVAVHHVAYPRDLRLDG
jgi:DNA-binding transcriptional ArsR family regulator